MKPLQLMITCLMLCPSFILQASQIKGGEEITITEPTTGNLYIAGEDLTINAKINGDLVAAGGKIIVNDSLMDDALLAAGEIKISGVAKDDIRLAAGKVIIKNNVHGDLVIGGGDIEITDEVTIFGDLIVGGGSVKFSGLVKGITKIYGGEIEFKGIATQEIEMKGGNIDISGEFWEKSSIAANRLMVHSLAKIKEDITYYSEEGEVDFGNVLQNGASATFASDLKPAFGKFDKATFRKGLLGMAVIRFLSVALLISLTILLFYRFFERTPDYLAANYLNNVGIGFLYVIAVPVLAIFSLVSVIGMPVGIILAVLYLFTLALGHVFAAVMGAYWYEDMQQKNWSKGKLILVAIGIWAVLKIVGFLPVVGWLVAILVAFLGFGTMYQTIRNKPEVADIVEG